MVQIVDRFGLICNRLTVAVLALLSWSLGDHFYGFTMFNFVFTVFFASATSAFMGNQSKFSFDVTRARNARGNQLVDQVGSFILIGLVNKVLPLIVLTS